MTDHSTPEQRLRDVLRQIATLRPTRGKKAAMRGALLQAQSLAANALGEPDITLGLDAYDRSSDDGVYTGEHGNLSMRGFRR